MTNSANLKVLQKQGARMPVEEPLGAWSIQKTPENEKILKT